MKNKFSPLAKPFIFLCFLLLSANILAQKVTGMVTDETGFGLPGVTIQIQGTSTGTVTNLEGKYTIEGVTKQSILVFSFIGYTKQEILVGDRTTINVTLKEDVTELEDVLVIGYGVQKKSDKTGSISAVSSQDFAQGAITSPQELIAGKISGVQITSDGGAPGGGSTIRIRGGSSLNASNNPLVIIDGVPIDDVKNDNVSGMRNPLNVINPNDIESFTVLKDASATAIYGSRASNGVIIITTKKGKKGKLSLTYQGNVSYSTVGKTAEVLDAQSYRETMMGAYPLLASLMGDANTDWMDKIFEPAVSTTHNLSFSGAVKELLPYRFSFGYNNNNGILKNSEQDRITTALNLNPTLFDDHLKINIASKFVNVKNKFANTDAIGSAMTMDPTQKPYDKDLYEEFGGYYAWTTKKGEVISIAPSNPLAQLEQNDEEATVNRFIGNVQFDYSFHFLPELHANLNLGTDFSKTDGLEIIDSTAAWDTDAFKGGGSNRIYKQEKTNDLLEFYLDYNKDLSEISSNLRVMAGYSWQHLWSENIDHRFVLNPETEDKRNPEPYNLDRTENYLVSFYGRLNYVFKNRYLLTFTLRNDGSSRFSEENRWGIFPSAALAWTVTNEPFMKNIDVFNDLKLRLGYGVTGQQELMDNDYPYFGTYTLSEVTASYVYTDPKNGNYSRIESITARPNGYDENLKWEETTTYNIGIDYGLYKNRINGSLELYFRETEDLISEVPVPAGSNFTNLVVTNVGSSQNKGIELNLSGHILSKKDLSWKLSATGSYNRRKITKLTLVDDPKFIGVLQGDISGGTGNKVQIHKVGATQNSFFVYKQKYEGDTPVEGEYVDLTKDEKINEADLRTYKSPSPDYIIGLSSLVSYKQFDLSISGHGSLGNFVYNNVASNTAYTDRLQTNGQFISNIGDDIYNTNFQKVQYKSDYYVQNASFFRLDNVQLSYNFKPFYKSIALKVYGSVNNVFTITGYDGVDPEIENGIDNDLYPRPRIFMLGINLKL